jgi:hypothetical protein
MKEGTYLAGQIERALHGDPRTHDLGIRVEVDGDEVVLRGQVAGEEGRRLAAQIAGQQAPGLPVRNEVFTKDVPLPAVPDMPAVPEVPQAPEVPSASDMLPLPEERLPAQDVPPPHRMWRR